jgi:MoaA/NifB/PqqE/SkfB family radical SAM enzyme
MKKKFTNLACPFCGQDINRGLPDGLRLDNILKTFKKIFKALEKKK